MSETSEQTGVCPLTPATEHNTNSPLWLRACQYLVFENPAVRLGFELSLSVIVYIAVFHLLPWNLLGVDSKWAALCSWFLGCSSVLLIDQGILCRASLKLRNAYSLSLHGKTEEALELLEKLGPNGNELVSLPIGLYHLSRAEMYLHKGQYELCQSELKLAEIAKEQTWKIEIRRSQAERAQGNFDYLTSKFGKDSTELDHPAYQLELGFAYISSRENWWAAADAFKKVTTTTNEAHHTGETTHVLAHAYIAVSDLWRGKAEEGIENITAYIERLKAGAFYVDRLRPVLSNLLLERAYYYATHREPSQAVLDYNQSLAFTKVAEKTALATKVREELLDRHEIQIA